MTDDDARKLAEAQEVTMALVNDSIAPMTAALHLAMLSVLDVLREEPAMAERFAALLEWRMAEQPEAVAVFARPFIAHARAVETGKETAH